MGPSRFTSHPRKVCCGFLSPLKIHRFGWVLNPQPFGSSGQHTNHYTTKATLLSFKKANDVSVEKAELFYQEY
jgi:hypothetical protein